MRTHIIIIIKCNITKRKDAVDSRILSWGPREYRILVFIDG